jgi:hypothetical protein
MFRLCEVPIPNTLERALRGPLESPASAGLQSKASMNQFTQWGPIAVIVAGYLLGICFQNRRIDDLKDTMNKRFDDMNRRQDDMRDLLKSEVNAWKSTLFGSIIR